MTLVLRMICAALSCSVIHIIVCIYIYIYIYTYAYTILYLSLSGQLFLEGNCFFG